MTKIRCLAKGKSIWERKRSPLDIRLSELASLYTNNGGLKRSQNKRKERAILF